MAFPFLAALTVGGVKTGRVVGAGRKAQKQAGEISSELFGYNFVNLIMQLAILYIAVWVLVQIYNFGRSIEGATSNPIIVNILNALGLKEYDFPDIKILNDLIDGKNGFDIWTVVNVLAVILILMEWNNFDKSQKALGAKANTMTTAAFTLIAIVFGLMSIPKVLEKARSIDISRGSGR